MQNSLKGRKMPKEFCEKQSSLKKGVAFSEEHKENLSKLWKKFEKHEMDEIIKKRNKSKMKKYEYTINNKKYFVHENRDEIIEILGSLKIYYTMNKCLKENNIYYNKRKKIYVSRGKFFKKKRSLTLFCFIFKILSC